MASENGKNENDDTGDPRGFKNLLLSTNWFIYPAVLVLYISTAILVLIGLYKLAVIIYDIFNTFYSGQSININLIAVQIISIIDTYILAVVIYILAVSLYKLFVSNFRYFQWLKIETLDDVKGHITKMFVLFLATMLVQRIAEWDDPVKILYHGITVTLLCLILIVFARTIEKRSSERSKDTEEKEE